MKKVVPIKGAGRRCGLGLFSFFRCEHRSRFDSRIHSARHAPPGELDVSIV